MTKLKGMSKRNIQLVSRHFFFLKQPPLFNICYCFTLFFSFKGVFICSFTVCFFFFQEKVVSCNFSLHTLAKVKSPRHHVELRVPLSHISK